MPTATDDKLAAMIGELAVSFAEFKAEYATQRAETKSDFRELAAQIKGEFRELEARNKGDLREFAAQIKGDLREFEARINGDIRELKAQVDGSIQNLDTKFGTGLHSLEKRVDRGFGLQMWLAGFLIPTTIGLISAAISLAFSAGHLDSSVKQLSTRMDGLEKALGEISPIPRQPNLSPPISPSVADPSERIFELRLKESMIGQIDMAIASGNNRRPEEDVPLYAGAKRDAGAGPGWLTNGMVGLVLLDGRLTADGIAKKLMSAASYHNEKFMKNQVDYSIYFQVKRSELEKFKAKLLSIDPAGNLPFSICFVRP